MLRKGMIRALALALLLPMPAIAGVPLETQILSVLNYARTNPAGFSALLQSIRGSYRAKILMLPGRSRATLTVEGVTAFDEAVAFLAREATVLPVQNGMLLAAAASDHVADQISSGAIGHADMDGAGPSERVQRRGGGFSVAEVIEYGALDAVDAVRQLIVDDGVPDRGHRQILFDPRLRFAGVACGSHPIYRTMCVIDLAITSDGNEPRYLEMAQITRANRR